MTQLPVNQWLRDLDRRKLDRQRVFTGFAGQSVTATGTASDNAADIDATLVVVSTATATGQGAVLPLAYEGAVVMVRNAAANPVNIYPRGADTLDGGTSAASVGTASSALYFAPQAGAWYSK